MKHRNLRWTTYIYSQRNNGWMSIECRLFTLTGRKQEEFWLERCGDRNHFTFLIGCVSSIWNVWQEFNLLGTVNAALKWTVTIRTTWSLSDSPLPERHVSGHPETVYSRTGCLREIVTCSDDARSILTEVGINLTKQTLTLMGRTIHLFFYHLSPSGIRIAARW